ncbi:phospholipase domain-containing protein [Streptomyces sp. NPDC001070]
MKHVVVLMQDNRSFDHYCEAVPSYAAAPDSRKRAVRFRMTSTSAAAVTFTIKANQYRTDGPWTYAVPAGGSVDDWFDAVACSAGWYDFTVTIGSHASWARCVTGHIETGAPSVTG